MKILLVNKFHYIVGGSETYYFALKNLLETKEHQVIEFSMKHPENIPSKYDAYFVENVDYNSSMSAIRKIKAAKKLIYSKEARQNIKRLILDTKPDIVHLHLFQHQLSSSILDACREFNLPVVYTAHELKMLCPNYKMLSNGRICQKCKGGAYYHCLTNKCVKKSVSKSALGTVDAYFQKMKKSYDVIDYIITPSDFYRKKFLEFGVPEERLICIPNFLDRECPKHTVKGEHGKFLYFGRLSEEKGILTLINAFRNLDEELNIVGTGPLKEYIEKLLQENDLSNIHVLGFKSGQELINIVANAKAVILPSEWYENGPYSAIEALQLGIPIIGADMGGIPELISGNGYLFESGNCNALRDRIKRLSGASENEYLKMKISSEKIFAEKYTAAVHYPKLLGVYEAALLKHGKGAE